MSSQAGLHADSEVVLVGPPDSRKEHELEQGEKTMEQTRDPNIVDWDGPDDPENPLNWPIWKKCLHVAYVSLFVLYA